MFYLFGAGSFCTSVIGFCGIENVIAIVDNNESKVGQSIKGKTILSYDEFKENYENEFVIITVQLCTEEIVEQLQKDEICRYLVFPFIQTSYYTAKQIIERWSWGKKEKIYTLGYPVISKIIGLLLGEDKVIQTECTTSNGYEEVYVLESMQIAPQAGVHYINIWEQIQIEIQDSYNRINALKNKYNGKRCFLIGNGPSLKEQDLELLEKNHEISFACNRIHLIYEKTRWRPTFYFLIDGKEYEHNKIFLQEGNKISFVKDFIGNEIPRNNERVFLFRNIDSKFYPGYPQFSEDVTECCYGGRTTMYQMMQFACFMGFSEIYLLGVDFSWGENGKSTHFVENYTDKTSITLGRAFKNEVEHAYIAARVYAEKHNIKIMNATRGGRLDVFERVDFDKLFEGEAYEM